MKNLIYANFFIIIAFVLSCNQQPNSPDKSVQLQFQFVNVENASTPKLIFLPDSSGSNSIQQLLKSESVEEVKVMILDFSMYDSSSQYFASDDYKAYTEARDSWPSSFSQWGEYEKLFKDHFRVVANQNLMIEDTQAKGVVAGVIGLNYIFLGIVGHGEIQEIYESEVVAVEGETATVYMGYYYHNFSN